jgi:hypothetical protein
MTELSPAPIKGGRRTRSRTRKYRKGGNPPKMGGSTVGHGKIAGGKRKSRRNRSANKR